MAVDNSIELFNCSLCSFCETSLDRLASHIRRHIKPEPLSNHQSLRDCSDGKDNFLSDSASSTSKKNCEQPGDVLASTINQLTNSSSVYNNNKTTPSPNIEVSNPRTLSQHEIISTSLHNSSSITHDVNARHNVILNQSTCTKQPPPNSFHPQHHHPPILKKSPHLVNSNDNCGGGVLMTSPHPPQHGMVITHNDGGRYPQQQQQQQQQQQHQFIDIKTMKSPYGTPLQLTNKPYHKTDYVPIAPANINTFQDSVAMTTSGIDHRRNAHVVKQNNSMLTMHTPPYVQQHQPSSHHLAQMPVNSDVRMRPLQVFPAYQSYHTAGNVDEYPYAQRQHTPQQQQQQHQQQHQQHQQASQLYHHVSQHLPKTSTSVFHHHANKGGEKKQPSPSQIQSQINDIHYSHATKQAHNVGVPNSGTLITNPENVLAALMNSISKDQLAGLLVVPLKKTSEIGVQTDPVEFTQHKDVNRFKEQNTCGVQTELRMQHITEVDARSHVPVFDNIRSTKGLFECLICGDEFASDQHCQRHVTEKHTHVCQNCYHTSTDLNNHQQHVNECGKYDAELLCMDCNNSFKSIKKLNQHRVKIHSARMPFRCGICNAPFETPDAVLSHMLSHDNDVLDFKCRHCTKVFKCPEALSKHVNRHKSVDVEHECRFCRKMFTCDEELKVHMKLAHVIVEPVNNNINADSPPAQIQPSVADKTSPVKKSTASSNRKYLLCSYCDLAFKNKELLVRHLGTCTKNATVESTQFVCDVCKEFFPTDVLKRQHIKSDHRRANGYRCPKCSKTYRTWVRLKFHTKQQHLRKVCSDCNTVFVKDHVLRKHQEDVHGKSERQEGDRVYTCSLCNATMYTLTGLMNHRRDFHPELNAMKTADQLSSATMLSVIDDPVNSGESNEDSSLHNCEQCSEAFTSSSMLNNHMRQHHGSPLHHQTSATVTKLNPFSCQKCSASFEDEKRMKNHLGLTHGERPFVCDICNKRFQYSSQIVWHMKNHRQGTTTTKISNKLWKGKFNKVKSKPSSLMSFICHFCGARFRQEKLLKNHKGTAHKIKLFSCDICSAKFGHSTELIWHVRTCKAKFMRENPGVELPTITTRQLSETTDTQSDEYRATESNNQTSTSFQTNENQGLDAQNDPDDIDNFDLHIRLTKEEGEELLKNDPEYDSNRSEYLCPLCSKTTKTITGMKTHYGRVHGVWGKETSHKVTSEKTVTVWPCQSCDQEFHSFEEVSEHCNSQHSITVRRSDFDMKNRQELDRKIIAVFTCGHCGVSFDNSKSVRVHSFKKHGHLVNDEELKRWRTDTGQAAQSDNALSAKSVKNESNITEKIPQPENGLGGEQSPVPVEPRFRCPRCGAKYRSTKSLRAHSLKRHKVILSKGELLSCKVFPDETEIRSTTVNSKSNKGHDLIESHNPCDKCGRVFGNYRALFTHYRQAHRMIGPKKELLTKKLSRTEIPMQQTSTITTPPLSEQEPNTSRDSKNVRIADSIECPKCVRVFTNHKSFVAHLFSAHRISKDQYPNFWPNGIPILPRESSTCPTCNKKCLDERAMRIHMFKAHGKRYKDYEQSEMTKDDKLSNGNSPKMSCCVCSESLDTEQAVIDHEYKLHNIKRVGEKRIFPEDLEYKEISKIDWNAEAASAKNNNGEESLPSEGTNTSSLDGNEGYNCPRCEAMYRNRRAITTHLCRVHRYKKVDIHLYFSNVSKDEDHTTTMGDEPSMTPDSEEQTDVTHNDQVDGNVDDLEMILPRGDSAAGSSDNVDNEMEHVNDNDFDVDKNTDNESDNMLQDVETDNVQENDNSQDDDHSLVIDERMDDISSNDNAGDTFDDDDDEKNNVDSDGISALIVDSKNRKSLNEVLPLPIIA